VHVQVANSICPHDWLIKLFISSQKPWHILFHKRIIVCICPELELPMAMVLDPTLPPGAVVLWNRAIHPGLMQYVRDFVGAIQQLIVFISSIPDADQC